MNIVIFGAPGAGKGTQSAKIVEKYGLHHISTGELLREQIHAGTELGRIADSYISEGHLIPDDLMIRILEAELDKPKAEKGVIFDGFPRTIKQAEALREMLERRGKPIDAVIGLEVGDDLLIERLINRGRESGRSDDNPEAITERMRVYHDTTSPLREFYRNEKLYRAIPGEGTVDQIFDLISKELEK